MINYIYNFNFFCIIYTIFFISLIIGIIVGLIYIKHTQKKHIINTISFSEQIEKRYEEIQKEKKQKNSKIITKENNINNKNKRIIL
jgi:uncharacterized membrane-anchored protein YhcB (DUF1043 family)